MIRLRSALAVSLVCMLAFAMLPATATAGKTAVPVKTASGTVRAASTYEVDQYDAAGMGDSWPEDARTVTIGDFDLPTIENHTLDYVDVNDADVDWIKFTVSADDVNIDKTSYLFRTQGTTYNMDTVIELYGPSATPTFDFTDEYLSWIGDPLAKASNDDDPFRAPASAYDSALVFRPTAPGTYWVRIRPYANSLNVFDCVAGPYTLTIKKGVLDRVWGLDRIQTAIATSKLMFQAAPGGTASLNKAAVVASAYNYPDALGGALLCGIANGPLLLSSPSVLSPGIADEIRRLGVDRVYVVGGTSALSDTVFAQLQAINPGIAVLRVKGDDRIWTAAEIAKQADSDVAGYVDETMPTYAIIAYAYNYPDALAASAFAAARNIPILLTGTATLAEDTSEIMYHLGTTDVIIMGGTGVISPAIQAALEARFGATHVMRISGDDRYETAKEFASWACDLKGPGARGNVHVGLPAAPEALTSMNPLHFGIASGQTFADALPGGVACGLAVPNGSPVLLTRKDSPYGYITAEHDGALPPGDTDWVSDVHSVMDVPFNTAMVFGGTAAVSHETAAILDNSLMLIDAP